MLEERDIQVRGYALRLPLDLLLVASANPEDYTNRGRIITPLKDRFGAEIRTHYPLDIADEVALIAQESTWSREVPDHLVEVIARFTDELRGSSAIDQRSGVSARFAVAAAEGIAGAALRRGALSGEDEPVARVGDLPAVLVTLQGKVEFEMGEEGREEDVFEHLLRVAIASTYREHLCRRRPERLHPALRRGRHRRDRRARAGGRPARPARHDPGLVGRPRGARRQRGQRLAGAGRGGDRVRPRGPAPDPPAVQGQRRRYDGLRDLTMSRPTVRTAQRRRGDGYRYGAWHGGPDPLEAPFDVRAAVDEIGKDMLEGRSVREALRDLLRRGTDGRRGLAGSAP